MHEGGHLLVGPPDESFSLINEREFRSAIAATETIWRSELAGEAPGLVIDAAEWAARLLYSACQFLVYREVPADAITSELSARRVDAVLTSAICYSVDVGLRALPDVVALARAASPDDVLVTALLDLARQWPLSSVGIRGVGDGDLAPFWSHASLRQLYVDRVIARGDISRIKDPLVADAVRQAIGGHDELAPALATELAST